MLCISFEPALKTREDPKTYNIEKLSIHIYIG